MESRDPLSDYRLQRASDIPRDGMWLELYEPGESEELLLAAFWSDQTNTMSLEVRDDRISDEVLAAFLERARRVLPPIGFNSEAS